MLETNIRLVLPGQGLYVWTRRARVTGPTVAPDLLQRACGSLRRRHGLAAVPANDDPRSLIVATAERLQPMHLEGEGWELDVVDPGTPNRRVTLGDNDGPELIPTLLERALLVKLSRDTDLWTLDSPRIWYEAEPFREQGGIAAYRRYEVSALWIEGEGVGIAADVGTAFFTRENLAYFFDPDVAAPERCRRTERFTELTGRQEGQKGTLIYDNGRSRTKCYFENAPEAITCAMTGKIRVSGRSYDSLLSYYHDTNPALVVDADTPAVRVSFHNLGRPQFVAADRVRARVMNEDVRGSLSSVDKVAPAERRRLIQGFWRRLGRNPLGPIAPGVRDGFWQPQGDRAVRLTPPNLTFGRGRRLASPAANTVDAYRAHFRQRGQYLEREGCYTSPPTMPRMLYVAYPKHLDECVAQRLASDLTDAISDWSGFQVCSSLAAYTDVSDAVTQLRARDQFGIAVFVLNDEPTAYHEAAFQLEGWRVKRITERTLHQQYGYVVDGALDKRPRSQSLMSGNARWRSFITLNALDVLQLLDVVPFSVQQAGPYEAHLVIDVGHDRRHFALSLLIARPVDRSREFRLLTHVEPKTDHQRETINAKVLQDQIVQLVDSALRCPCTAIQSLLVLRDGLLNEQGIQGIDQALEALVGSGKISTNARVDLAELRKDTLKSLRLWEIEAGGTVNNPLEGSVVQLNEGMVLLASTGVATLHQGTAEPLLIVGNGRCSSPLDVASAVFDAAQLNWSSPTIAQRLPVPLKRTDEELRTRAAQEIRRLR